MNQRELPDYELIETEDALLDFYETNKDVEWFCFDTEFIGERRFITLLCLIQVATEHGLYLIDTIKLDNNIDPFLQIIEDERVMNFLKRIVRQVNGERSRKWTCRLDI